MAEEIKKLANGLASLGRYEDSYIVHAAEGETVIPEEVFDENPSLKEDLFKQMRAMGVEPERGQRPGVNGEGGIKGDMAVIKVTGVERGFGTGQVGSKVGLRHVLPFLPRRCTVGGGLSKGGPCFGCILG